LRERRRNRSVNSGRPERFAVCFIQGSMNATKEWG